MFEKVQNAKLLWISTPINISICLQKYFESFYILQIEFCEKFENYFMCKVSSLKLRFTGSHWKLLISDIYPLKLFRMKINHQVYWPLFDKE